VSDSVSRMSLLQYSAILKYFSVPNVNPVTIIEKGENVLKSDHLLKLEVAKDGTINAVVRRSYVTDEARAYHLQVTLPNATNTKGSTEDTRPDFEDFIGYD